MNVELTIQNMFDKYPDIFQTRDQCYNHLFCVLGNGYKWSHGELIPCGHSQQSNPKEIDILTSHLKDGKAYQHIQPRCTPRRCRKERWYFVGPTGHDKPQFYTEHVPLFNIPSDVQIDWLNAINECKQMLKEDGITIPT